MSKTTRDERDARRPFIRFDTEYYIGSRISGAGLLSLLDDADRLDEIMGPTNAALRGEVQFKDTHIEQQSARISALEAALRKVDEIRKDMDEYNYGIAERMQGWVDALKSACMEVEK